MKLVPIFSGSTTHAKYYQTVATPEPPLRETSGRIGAHTTCRAQARPALRPAVFGSLSTIAFSRSISALSRLMPASIISGSSHITGALHSEHLAIGPSASVMFSSRVRICRQCVHQKMPGVSTLISSPSRVLFQLSFASTSAAHKCAYGVGAALLPSL